MTEIVTGIALSGFKYPLENETIRWGSTLCVSNELVEEKKVLFFFSVGHINGGKKQGLKKRFFCTYEYITKRFGVMGIRRETMRFLYN
ncbi:hypothetical protein GCM10020331_047380 [Ectobacillus funiculus]